MFSMHGNGNTFRHNGTDLSSLENGVWVYGPQGNADDNRYAGIASVVTMPDGSILGAVHQENHSNVASIGLVRSTDTGYTWDYLGTVIRGEGLTTGFRGASLPSMHLDGNTLRMVYENRYGDGQFQDVRSATASVSNPTAWTPQGVLFANDGDPHFYSAGPRLYSTADGWMVTYSTDRALRYRTSSDFRNWSAAETIDDWPQVWSQGGSGERRWYGHFLDPSQDVSSVFASGVYVEHWLDLDSGQRWPRIASVN